MRRALRCVTTDVRLVEAGSQGRRPVILPEIVKRAARPDGACGDDQWFDWSKWVHFAMINAEELGVNSRMWTIVEIEDA
jgi:hypothetical protein